MKRIFLGFYGLLCFMVSYAQKVDANDDCILKYNHSIFNLNERHTIPITIFYYPNGNFFVKNGHIDRIYENEDVFHRFYQNGELIKYCYEEYDAINDDVSVSHFDNLFQHYEYNLDSSYFIKILAENSLILNYFNEHELFLSKDFDVIRITYLCSDFSDGMFEPSPLQYYNVMRVNFSNDSSKLVFKCGHFNNKGGFTIDADYSLSLDNKEVKRIEKTINALSVGDDKIFDTDNTNILYELYLDGRYYVTFQNRFFHDRNKDARNYFGLYAKLMSMVRKKTKKNIIGCD
ncbi:MAG: hypothetical protein ACOCXH_15355 [Cyclobacteriaceae bacterium]